MGGDAVKPHLKHHRDLNSEKMPTLPPGNQEPRQKKVRNLRVGSVTKSRSFSLKKKEKERPGLRGNDGLA